MASPCIGFEIGLGHICWYFRAYICSKILKVLHPCIGFGIGLGHVWGHANAWIWYIHAYAWILYIHVLSHTSHIPKAEIFGFMFQYLSSERMGLRFWANPIHNTWLDHGDAILFCNASTIMYQPVPPHTDWVSAIANKVFLKKQSSST